MADDAPALLDEQGGLLLMRAAQACRHMASNLPSEPELRGLGRRRHDPMMFLSQAAWCNKWLCLGQR